MWEESTERISIWASTEVVGGGNTKRPREHVAVSWARDHGRVGYHPCPCAALDETYEVFLENRTRPSGRRFTMPGEKKVKKCFVIAPIGEEGSEIRRRSDQVLAHIIEPAASECGYTATRADEMSEPGMITSQVIQRLVNDPLVVADLTGRNPNVFYELAVRHAVRKPCVQVIQLGEAIPFDVAQSRTIQVDHHDLDSVARCREQLVAQIRSVEKDPTDVDTPISVAIDLQSLRQSENPLEKSSAEIISMLQDLRAMVADVAEMSPRRTYLSERGIRQAVFTCRRLARVLALGEGEEPSGATFEEAHALLRRLERLLDTMVIEGGFPGDVEPRYGPRRKITD
jgi:hypothetical protein